MNFNSKNTFWTITIYYILFQTPYTQISDMRILRNWGDIKNKYIWK